jgi:hypothetical protein
MRSGIRGLRVQVVALLMVALVAGVARGGDPEELTPKEASAAFKKVSASHLKFLKSQIKDFSKQFSDQVDAAVLAAITSPIAPEALLVIVHNHIATTYLQLQGVINVVNAAIESDGAALLAQTTGHPSDFLIGDCGVIDEAREGVLKELLKFRDKLEKKLKKIAKTLGKNGYEFGSTVAPPEAGSAAPNPDDAGAPVPAIRPLKVDSTAGTSSAGEQGDGSLAVGGSADSSNGTVTVVINGPTGATATVAGIAVVNGRWSAAFTAGDLPEGNYRITVSQGGVEHTVDAGIP